MKRLIYTAFLIASTSAIQADELTFYGGTSRTKIEGATSADTIILDSSAGSLYGAGGITVNKIISINGDAKGDVDICNTIDWNSGKGITVDANTASGEFTAIDVNSWKHNLFALTIKNSASATDATVNLNFGSLLQVSSGGNTQNQYIYFDSVKANVTAAATTIGNTIDKGSVLGVKSTADVTWNGNISIGKSGILNLDGKLTLAGTLSSSGTINSAGNLVQNAAADTGITFSGNAEMNSGSNWTIQGKLIVQNNSTTTVNEGAYLTFVPNASNSARVILNRGSLILNQKNALITNTGEPKVAIVTLVGVDNINNVFINADQEIKSFFVNGNTLNIYLDDLVKISLTDAENAIGYLNSASLNIYNFQEDNFYVGTVENIKNNVESIVSLYDENGDYLGAATVNDLGYITLLTVPEPAEWAAIFGALALGLAMYRRRK